MFTMTDLAGEYLHEVLDTAHAAEETVVRFVVKDHTLKPTLDTARPGDATFDHDGRTVLVLDRQVMQAVADSTLDVQATEEGPQLILLQ